ncbi:Uncharacterized protein Rs2_48600 [Raphanus sativus]|uniref:Uncharacterized protein LOC108852121 isoform X1 n=1 Tax=Raphanus sativus TaxID=3726 RepID=A0A6J0N9B7_RAPSA|nr:uncharacterized protein LOC108852121 isoform X1 [Raphanus sativus]KAJ4869832.1 Uncharacterized protein Rs2_48600 [Raphanus sativus]
MSNERATSPAIPPQPSEHQPPNQINSAPSPPQATMNVVVANSNGVSFDEEPSCFKYLDSREYGDKYKRYESEFKQWVLSKHIYPNAVNLYEGRTIIGGETILSSKWPCTRFYADPCISFAEEEESLDSPPAEIGGLVPNGSIVSE